MYKDGKILDEAVVELKKEFGEIGSQSDEFGFNFTDYYENESGKNLKKKFLSFNKTINDKELSKIRLTTAKIEDKFRVNGKRTVNIDPGYVSKEGVFMASVKRKHFKTDIGNGIWLHKVLGFEDDKIIEFKQTFADYRVKQNQDFFNKVKKDLLN